MDQLTILAYPFLFATIYFEAFALVTLLSGDAKARRARSASLKTPKVAIVVPCYNEEATIAGTVRSLLALKYPKELLQILLVDDGSVDGTGAVMDRFAAEPQVAVIHQANAGKHAALNAGIAAAGDAELIGCLDADSFVEPTALREIIACFDDPSVGAATSAMSVHEPRRFVEHIQNAEYVLGIAFRHILSVVNGIYVTPGPFSVYRRDAVVALGGFRKGHNTEDMEMALRLQREGYAIDSAIRARVYTKAPASVPALVRQRTRWTTGFLRNMLIDYRDLVGNPRYGALGLLVLPFGFLAVAGTLLLFFVALLMGSYDLAKAYANLHGLPLSYLLTPPHPTVEWLYLPVTVLSLLSVTAMLACAVLIVVGKRISDTPAKLTVGSIGYFLLYGLIAPFWLMRAVADVAIGYRRSWR